MGYYPTKAKKSSKDDTKNSTPSGSTPSQNAGKTDTDRRIEASPKYVGSKYTPSPQPAGTPVQTIRVSGSGSSTKTIAASGASAADVAKFQQNVNQPRSNVVSNIPQQTTPGQQRINDAAANFQQNYSPNRLQNVSVMPGVTPQLKQGGYIVGTQQGYKTPAPRYVPVSPEGRQIAATEAGYLRTGKAAPKKYDTFTTENVLMALPLPEAPILRALGIGGKGVAAAERAAAPAEAGLIKRGATYAAETAVKGYNYIAPTKAYKYAKTAAGGIATAETVRYGITEGSALGLPAEQRAIRAEPGFKQAVGTAYAETGTEQFNQAWYKGAAYQIPGVPLVLGREGFKEKVTAQFQQQGYTGAELDKRVNVAMGELYAGQIGEGAGFLSISRSSEKIGRGLIAGSFEKAAVKGETATTKTVGMTLFKKTAPSIAAAGVVEGVGGELVQERSRQQTLSGQQLALMGVFGGASAGLIGGTIAATSVRRPVVSKTIETAAYLSDPFEKPGDVLQNIAEYGQKKFYGTEAPKPQIFTAINPNDIINFGTTGGKAPTKETPGKVYSFGIPKGVSTPTGTPTTTQTPASTMTKGTAEGRIGTPPVPPYNFNLPSNSVIMTPLGTPTQTRRAGGGGGGSVTPVQIFQPVGTPVQQPSYRVPSLMPNFNIPNTPFTPVPTQPRNNIPTNPFTSVPNTPTNNIPVNPFTNVPVNPLTTVPVNPFTAINIPTTVPVGRIPPPMPLSFGDLFGGGASYGGKRKVYINELAAGSNLLNNIMTGNKLQPIKKFSSTTKHKKHKSKKVKK